MNSMTPDQAASVIALGMTAVFLVGVIALALRISAAIEDEAMMTVTVPRTTIEKIARSVLARNGITGIWQLHVAAADAHRTGHPQSAGIVLEIAEVAEEVWMKAEVMRSFAL